MYSMAIGGIDCRVSHRAETRHASRFASNVEPQAIHFLDSPPIHSGLRILSSGTWTRLIVGIFLLSLILANSKIFVGVRALVG